LSGPTPETASTEDSDAIILALNAGSSSLKFALFRLSAGEGEVRLAEGAAEGVGLDRGRLWFRSPGSAVSIDKPETLIDYDAAVHAAFDAIDNGELPSPAAVGHRLVHGGPRHQQPERVDASLLESLRAAIPYAPLHLPSELGVIEAVRARYPDLPQVACFDTAFFGSLPDVARRLPLPRKLHDQGIRRYGFHGLSYEYLVEALGSNARGRAIFAHLGNGASMVALRDGTPQDTTMGFTPSGGFMMGTRTGDLDPGVLLYLLDGGMSPGDLAHLVNHESGLLGVSGSTSDMKRLLERRIDDAEAGLAFEMFCYQIRKFIGGFAAVLGGVDCLVFTGGIGEHAAAVRDRVCSGLDFLGIRLDAARNHDGQGIISAAGSPCTVRVVSTDEARMIARHTRRIVFRR